MKEARPDVRYVSLPFDLLDWRGEEVPRLSTQERHEVANLGDVSEYLVLMHRALERSSATGQP